MSLILAAAVLLASTAAADERPRPRNFERVLAIRNEITEFVGHRRPTVVGQIDVYIDDSEREGPFHLRINSSAERKMLWVEVFDLRRPAMDVASDIEREGLDLEHAPRDRDVVRFRVDAKSCPRLARSAEALRGAFMHAIDRFSSTNAFENPNSGAPGHVRLVEVQMVGPDYEVFSISKQYPGPPALMRRVNEVAQIASSCSGKPVRPLVFDAEPSSHLN